jgi:hypothetical protein
MLRLSLAQVPRLLEIERNTHERLEEARRMQWLGEVSALEESLRHIANKKRHADRLRQHANHDEAGTGASAEDGRLSWPSGFARRWPITTAQRRPRHHEGESTADSWHAAFSVVHPVRDFLGRPSSAHLGRHGDRPA